MSDEEKTYLKRELEEIKKTQDNQGKQINKLCNILIPEEESGVNGLGKRVKDLEEEVSTLKIWKRRVNQVTGWSIGAISAIATWIAYNFKWIWHVITGTGKS